MVKLYLSLASKNICISIWKMKKILKNVSKELYDPRWLGLVRKYMYRLPH